MRSRVEVLTQERLRERLDYDPMTGVFTWKQDGKGGRGIRRGARAGSVDPNGYRYIRIDGRDYLAQRLAWFWSNNKWPEQILRFQDHNKDNCAVANLFEGGYVTTEHDWRTPEGRKANRKKYYDATKDRTRDYRLGREFGISLDQYNEMYAAQDGKCAICGNPETATRNGKTRWLAVDHCHDTGRVRSLLCGNCNPMIGYAKDKIEVLERAIAYLKSHQHGGPV